MVTLPKGLTYEDPASFFTANAVHYENAFSNNTGLKAFVKTFADLLPHNATVLDAGCGSGRPVAETLDSIGCVVTGIDVAHGMLEMSRSAVPNATFELADYTSYSPTEPFDAAIQSLSLFALSREELRKMGKRWSQWVKLGGFVATVNLVADEPDGHGTEEGGMFLGHHVKTPLLTKQEWIDVYEANGFEIVATEQYEYAPPAEYESGVEKQYCLIGRKIGAVPPQQ